jgi:hypothetical protein
VYEKSAELYSRELETEEEEERDLSLKEMCEEMGIDIEMIGAYDEETDTFKCTQT